MSRTHRALLAAGAVVVVAAAATAAWMITAHRGNARPPTAPALHTTVVVRQDLVTSETLTGRVTFRHPRTLRGAGTGVVTELPRAGTTTERGATLLRIDDRPVPVFYGSTPMFRPLDRLGITGADVDVLARNLRALGFFSGYLPDDPHQTRFTALLRDDLKAWQRSIGAPVTGRLAVGDVIVLPHRARVDRVVALLGDPAAEPLATLSDSALLVSGPAPAGANGGTGTIELPDGGRVAARVTVTTPIDGSPAAFVAVPRSQAAMRGQTGTVRVVVVTERRPGVLTVPIVALLALRGGTRYALQLTDGRLVPVTTGLFTADRVEVSGAGLRPGLRVVTAA